MTGTSRPLRASCSRRSRAAALEGSLPAVMAAVSWRTLRSLVTITGVGRAKWNQLELFKCREAPFALALSPRDASAGRCAGLRLVGSRSASRRA
jgi:hypothetical protein